VVVGEGSRRQVRGDSGVGGDIWSYGMKDSVVRSRGKT